MNEYITVTQMSRIWHITPRRIQEMCAQGLIPGAVKFGRCWAVPKNAQRPADHRERQYRSCEAGFTLIEMLVVIAIIAVLVAVVIPTVTSATEKSRETVDISNVRSAYSAVMNAAILGDTGATYNGASIYQAATDSYAISVPLKQQQEGWTSGEKLTIAGVSQGDRGWKGSPEAGGACMVSYSEANGATFDWGGKAVSLGGSLSGSAITLNKRWTIINNRLSATYQDIPADNYKASVISELVDVSIGQYLKLSSLSEAGSDLDTANYKYTVGYFVVDAANTNSDGNYKILHNSGEKQYLDTDSFHEIASQPGHSKDPKVAIQLFKIPKNGNRPVDLTETEAKALCNLISITDKK